ncbi:MAG: 2-phospho-L-lactate transferase [Anaerolineales bacterium]
MNRWGDRCVVALAGGVGGARLVDGLAKLLAADRLTAIVNTGDDFEFLGLSISPDLDTVLYTLAGLADPTRGWGIRGDTFSCLEALQGLGDPSWFQVGDRDLATHLVRTRLLWEGRTLTQVSAELGRRLKVLPQVLPMSDDLMRTWVLTDKGPLPFQDYFVRCRCEPKVKGFRFEGEEAAQPSPEAAHALDSADLAIICPSNPLVSIDPILRLPGNRERLARLPSVAVSPIRGGAAVKGPLSKMLRELGRESSALEVARHYQGLVRGFVLDEMDSELSEQVEGLGMRVAALPTLMVEVGQRVRVAQQVLEFAESFL